MKSLQRFGEYLRQLITTAPRVPEARQGFGDSIFSRNAIGIAIILAACAAPLIWLPGIAQGRYVIALFSQYLGLIALITMALAHLIATLARWLWDRRAKAATLPDRLSRS